jgi:uncharacterized membrane protein HdeD (DUF308 family)
MLLSSAASGAAPRVALTSDVTRRIAIVRAGVALIWAAAFVIAVGDEIPRTGSDVTFAASALLVLYPLIDVIASLAEAQRVPKQSQGVLRANAAISLVAAVALGGAAFGADAGAVLVAFGAWAVVSGAIQLGVAIRRRRDGGREVPMILSGGLSAVVGVGFIAASQGNDAHLANLGGYAAFGAVLYLLWAARSRAAHSHVTRSRAY